MGIPAGSHPDSCLVKHQLVYIQALLKGVKGVGEGGYRNGCIQSVLAEDDPSVEHLAAVEVENPQPLEAGWFCSAFPHSWTTCSCSTSSN